MQNPYKFIMLILLAAFIAANLTACGRYSQPYPVKGSGFPHSYPHEQEQLNGR
ncbi:MAG: hypothetical protein IJS88_00695 [Alphaproteobacteria bacterium]|nr:hypothetical protein [Alphaproteobacteria bacterium]